MIAVSHNEIRGSYLPYLSDESKLSGDAEMLYFPEHPEELSAILCELFLTDKTATMQGSRTGVAGGCVPFGGTVVNMEKLRSIEINAKTESGLLLKIGPGASLAEMTAYLKKNGADYFLPVNPTEDTASIGGMIATNASGSRSFSYGPIRKYIRGLKVYIPAFGELSIRRSEMNIKKGVIRIGSRRSHAFESWDFPDIKNNAGPYYKTDMDLIDLFIGSEGIFGTLLEADLLCVRRPRHELILMAFFHNRHDALNFLETLRRSPRMPSEIEYFDENSLSLAREDLDKLPAYPFEGAHAIMTVFLYEKETEIENIYEMLEKSLSASGGSIDDTWTPGNETESTRFRIFRHIVPEAVNRRIAAIKTDEPAVHKVASDTAVPVNLLVPALNEYDKALSESGLEHCIFGHIGDAHLHINMLPRNIKELETAKDTLRKIMQTAKEMGGTISGEHGIGKIKKEYLASFYGSEIIARMRAIKHFFDPHALLNPGDVFDR